MSVKTYQTTTPDRFARIAAYVGYLFEDVPGERTIESHHFECSQPASRGLNRPCELSELMARTIAP